MSLATRKTTAQEYSHVQPLWKFCFLSIITLNIYQLVWGYKHFKLMKDLDKSNLVPWAWAWFMPFSLYHLAKKYFALAKRKGWQEDPSPMNITVAYFFCASLSKSETGIWLLSLLSFWPLLIILRAANFYWQKQQPNLPIRKSWTIPEIIWTVFGLMLWASILITSIMPSANAV
jgi:hypothetical protein